MRVRPIPSLPEEVREQKFKELLDYEFEEPALLLDYYYRYQGTRGTEETWRGERWVRFPVAE